MLSEICFNLDQSEICLVYGLTLNKQNFHGFNPHNAGTE